MADVGEVDLHLLDQGRHLDLHRVLGAHLVDPRDARRGTEFAVWAPHAAQVSVVGDWNFWDQGRHPMTRALDGPVWTARIGRAKPGHRYKFAITGPDGTVVEHADPMARRCEPAPATASIIERSRYRWRDDAWLARRAESDPWHEPMSIYEVHLGSWRRDPAEPHRERSYRETAPELAAYAVDMGFTHVELLPVMAHPFAGSWGYQVTGYFAPVARWGTPDELRFLIDTLHRAGIGVLLDWVPGHFPKDEWALARFDGTPLYEPADPKRAEHPDWGTFEFDFGRGGVRSFLLSNARYWLEEFHADGLRVDAVASMIYLDYSRKKGEWTPNVHGGNEHLEAVSLLRELNVEVHAAHPGVISVAEESTAWPGVSRPVDHGGLGFGFKWNLGWMHDTLGYLGRDPVHRVHHHDELTFGAHYAWSENFVLPLSHDEVVHGKGSLLGKMAGDEWQRRANLRALLAWMWAHPGKQLLFMGGELGQVREWNHDSSIDWHLLDSPDHAGIQSLVRDLNHLARARPALWSIDFEPDGFSWILNDPPANLSGFVRTGSGGERLACLANLSPVGREVGLDVLGGGRWRPVLDTDDAGYGGAGLLPSSEVDADAGGALALPALSVRWFEPV